MNDNIICVMLSDVKLQYLTAVSRNVSTFSIFFAVQAQKDGFCVYLVKILQRKLIQTICK